MPRKRKAKPLQKGKLRIGDQWSAITIIARSQSHVLKAVCELVENSIDASAKNITLARRKIKHQHFLEVTDDGKGLRINQDGMPDFKYVATHICDSIKRYLKDRERTGVHGEFGIGLLGFWSLGKQLSMYASDAKGKSYQMIMKAGAQTYTILPFHGSLFDRGVKVVIGPLHSTTKNLLTCDRLEKYLSYELRDRIKNTGVNIEIFDRISRKNKRVVPREYDGERLDGFNTLHSPFGEIHVELYLAIVRKDQEPHISLSKDGTRVKRSIAELENFDNPVWSSPYIEGNIDCPFIDLTPGTRDSVVHNEKFEAFLAALKDTENRLGKIIEARERAEDEKASEAISRDIKKALTVVLSELPQNEYVWFDVAIQDKSKTGNARSDEGMLTDAEEKDKKQTRKEKPGAIPTFLDEIPDEPAACRISPRVFSVSIDGQKTLSARVFDAKGIEIKNDLTFDWQLVSGLGELAEDVLPSSTIFKAGGQPSNVLIKVTIKQGVHEVCAECKGRVLLSEEMEQGVSIGKGLPNYRLRADFTGGWRSRYLPDKNIIEINSGHRDFLATRQVLASHRRYIAKLYAKEIIMLNFPGVSQEESLERIIELLVRMEKLL